MSFEDFTAIPPDDPQTSPDEDLSAAVAGALAVPDPFTPVPDDPPAPFGRSWKFDWEAGQFVKNGLSPVDTSGFGALSEWAQMAVHSARYAHEAFSDDFGMERPNALIGEFAVGEALADWQTAMVEALLVHDRITAVENLELRWESSEGTLYIDSMDLITDEDETVTVSDVTLRIGAS